MNASTNINLRVPVILGYAFMFFLVFLLGIMLAQGQRGVMQMALFSLSVVGLATLPYHAQMSSAIILAAFNSALLVPFAPGPLPLADAACLLGWSGTVMAVLMRRYPADAGLLLRRYRWVFVGIVIYLIALAIIVKVRGVGFGSMGATAGGGKIYFQQIVYSIVPFLFLVTPFEEKLFLRLVTLYFVLSVGYLISEVVLVFVPGLYNVVLRLFQLPTDAWHFDLSTQYFGFRRLQSLFFACPNLVYALLLYFTCRDVLGRHAWWLVPVIAGLLAAGMGSGHRATLIHTSTVIAVIFWAQRAYSQRNVLILTGTTVLALVAVYALIDTLPAALQRSVSFLPGIDVHQFVAADAAGTLRGRLEVSRRGLELIPEYLWLGRGFTRYFDIVPYSREAIDSVSYSVLQGHFLNGFVGLMVNTGILGTLGMGLFFIGGTALALRVITLARAAGFDSVLARTASVVGSLYLVNTFFFFLIEGYADTAMRRFAVNVGMLIVCLRLLERRLAAQRDEAGVAAA